MLVSQQKPQTLHSVPCNRCRAHKKKCDRLAICSNCFKRKVACEYNVDEHRKPYHNNLTEKFKKLATTVNSLIDKIEIEARVPRGKRYNPSTSNLGKLQDLETYHIPLLYFQLVKINDGIVYNRVSNSTTENLLNMFFWYLHPLSTFINKGKVFELCQLRENGSNPLIVCILLRAQIFFMNYFNPEQPPIRQDLYLYKLACHLIKSNTENSSLELIQACLLMTELEASFLSPKAEYYLNMAVKMSHMENLHSIENYTDNQISQEDKIYNYMTYLMLVTMEERLFYQVKRTGLTSVSNKYNLLHISNCSTMEKPIDLMIYSQVVSHYVFYLGDVQSRVNMKENDQSNMEEAKSKLLTANDLDKILKSTHFALNFPLAQSLQDLENYFKNGFCSSMNSRIVIFITLAIMVRFLIDLTQPFKARKFNYEKIAENESLLNEINSKLEELKSLDHVMCYSVMKFANTEATPISNRYGLHPIELSDLRVCYMYFYTLKYLIDSGIGKDNPQLSNLAKKIKLTCRLWANSSPLYNLVDTIASSPPSVTIHDFDNMEKYSK